MERLWAAKLVVLMVATLVVPVAMVGCATVDSSVPAAGERVELAVPSEPSGTSTGGGEDGDAHERPDRDLSHAPSGMRFPIQVEGFQRDGMAKYDDQGDDVSVGYHRLDEQMAMMATVYIYPTHRYGGMDSQFGEARDAVLRNRKGSELLAEGDMQIFQRGEYRTGRRAHFLVRDPKGDRPLVVSHLFLFEYGPWFIKYRATFPADQHEACDEALLKFMSALPWPDIHPGRLAGR